ncbi:uncharacterized protein LOC109703949 [Ananas comosus]|uniref:Uncharacterized protein LOC109703949 n=1 Tax=Ananas comosus TaxID=4615 RepID=A0A199V7S4_ANACO|nr:uncharacterized protein LOC109703949 [Ananas comosus]OAY73063.1 hypothetical protein ACMD2_22312 [Ananas comosus]
MGCVSSKTLVKSGSLREKLNQSFQKRNVFEEVLTSNSRSSGDQFLALLRNQNSATKSIKATTPFSDKPEPDLDEKADNSIVNSPPLEPSKIETINTWELLAGLEEENCEEEQKQEQEQEQETMHSKDSNAEVAGRARSFRTVEDYDAMVAGSDLPEEAKEIDSSSYEQIVEKKEEKKSETSSGKQSNELQAKVSKRKAMAKELSALKVTTFEFNKSGSLREWLLQGGQVFSPGSYVTPKFGDFVASETKIGDIGDDDHTIFDPELVAQFEQAMKQLTVEEEFILREIEEVSEEGDGEEISKVELLHEPIKVDFQGAVSV